MWTLFNLEISVDVFHNFRDFNVAPLSASEIFCNSATGASGKVGDPDITPTRKVPYYKDPAPPPPTKKTKQSSEDP